MFFGSYFSQFYFPENYFPTLDESGNPFVEGLPLNICISTVSIKIYSLIPPSETSSSFSGGFSSKEKLTKNKKIKVKTYPLLLKTSLNTCSVSIDLEEEEILLTILELLFSLDNNKNKLKKKEVSDNLELEIIKEILLEESLSTTNNDEEEEEILLELIASL